MPRRIHFFSTQGQRDNYVNFMSRKIYLLAKDYRWRIRGGENRRRVLRETLTDLSEFLRGFGERRMFRRLAPLITDRRSSDTRNQEIYQETVFAHNFLYPHYQHDPREGINFVTGIVSGLLDIYNDEEFVLHGEL